MKMANYKANEGIEVYQNRDTSKKRLNFKNEKKDVDLKTNEEMKND